MSDSTQGEPGPQVGPPQEQPLVVAAGIDQARLAMDPLLQLKARTPTEVIGASFGLCRRHLKLFAGIAAVMVAPELLLNVGCDLTANPERPSAAYGVLLALSVLVSLVLSQFVRAAMIKTISDAYLGQPAEFGRSYRFTLGRLGAYLQAIVIAFLFTCGAAMVPGALVACGAALAGESAALGAILSLAGAVGFLYVALVFPVALAFVNEAVLIDGRTGSEAIRRSWELARGRWSDIFTTLLLTGLVYTAVLMVVCLVPVALQTGAVVAGAASLSTVVGIGQSVLIGLLNLTLTPFVWGVTTLLYYDCRIRHEAFDLEQLAASAVAFG